MGFINQQTSLGGTILYQFRKFQTIHHFQGLSAPITKGVSRSYSGFTFTKIDTGLLHLTFRTNRNIFQPQLVFSWNLCKIDTGSIFEFPIVLGIFLRPPAHPRPLDMGFRACKDNRCRRSHRSVRPGSKLGPCGPWWTMDYPKAVGVKFLVI